MQRDLESSTRKANGWLSEEEEGESFGGKQCDTASAATTSDFCQENQTPSARSELLEKQTSKTDQAVENGPPEFTETHPAFEGMGLREQLLRGIYAYGYEHPSVIQQRAIVPCCSGKDVIAQAQSGTGKTATFAIAMLQQLDVRQKHCQV